MTRVFPTAFGAFWAMAVLVGQALGQAPADTADPGGPGAPPVLQAPTIQAEGGVVVVAAQALRPLAGAAAGRLSALIRFPEAPSAPVLGPEFDAPGAGQLRRLYARGLAAGHHGDLYDNRDRDHSPLPKADFPQLTHIVYGPGLRSGRRDYGAAAELIFNAPLIGNSSTALTSGAFWRSQPRFLLTQERAPRWLFQNYVTGQIYVYPEHRDHDPERGDLFPANTPYFLVSQGSSSSDQPHLRALAMILAAFRPDTKARLIETGLLAPTVQMVYRRARGPVLSRAAYLSGLAHPTVFDAKDIKLDRMVALANAIAPDAVPPLVQLAVLSETQAEEGVDYFGQGLEERLFDTPSAIARIWRSRAGRREMLISAEATQDPNGRPVSFDWVLLRGDPARTRIEPLAGGRQARITIDWQAPLPAPGTPEITAPRVDIGVFANNGAHDSAPGIVSVLLPAHETRLYKTDPDGVPRVQSIDYSLAPEGYADPLLFPRMAWRDEFDYDATGALTGWTRHAADGAGGAQRFDAQGAGQGAGESGRPTYIIEQTAGGVPQIRAQ